MDRPNGHGSLRGAEWVDEAVVLIPLSINRLGGTKAEWLSAHQALAAAFTAVGSTGETCELHFEHGGSEFVMFGTPRMPRVNGDNLSVGKSVNQVAFVAADPRIYSSTLSTASTGLTRYVDGLVTPFTTPFTVRTVQLSGSVNVHNLGTAAAGVTVRIDGPVEDPVIVLQRPDGSVQRIIIDIELHEDQYLLVDSVRKTALLDGSPAANFRGAAQWGWEAYPLLPGVTEFRFWAASYQSGAEATIESRSAWW
jgi:hypothetical protein